MHTKVFRVLHLQQNIVHEEDVEGTVHAIGTRIGSVHLAQAKWRGDATLEHVPLHKDIEYKTGIFFCENPLVVGTNEP